MFLHLLMLSFRFHLALYNSIQGKQFVEVVISRVWSENGKIVCTLLVSNPG
jgi:hypothetical protein